MVNKIRYFIREKFGLSLLQFTTAFVLLFPFAVMALFLFWPALPISYIFSDHEEAGVFLSFVASLIWMAVLVLIIDPMFWW